MTAAMVLTPVRLPSIMRWEILVRLGVSGLLGWQGIVSGDPLVLGLCGLAALYHAWVAFRLGAYLIPGATRLTLDGWGVTLRELWRDHRHSWVQIRDIAITEGRPLAQRRPGVVLALGDAKGSMGTLLVPDVFASDRRALALEISRFRTG